MDCSRIPSACNGIAAFTVADSIRNCIAVSESQEVITAGIVTVNRSVYSKEAVMVAALAVFGFMINGASLDLDFADA